MDPGMAESPVSQCRCVYASTIEGVPNFVQSYFAILTGSAADE